MYKYTMTIDNETYTAIFTDHFEADAFITSNEADGSIITNISFKEITSADQILSDNDFEENYKIEMVGEFLFPNKRFKKIADIEKLIENL